MLKAARQKEIVALLQGGGVVEVSVLAERFQTSPITVRRDLIELQERGVLARTRGGAIPGNEVYAEGWARYESVSYAERERENYREKRAIVLSELVCACHARRGNVSCPLIASLQGGASLAGSAMP